MFPNQTDILLCGCELEQFRREKLSYWDETYGFKLSPMKDMVIQEPLVTVIDSQEIITNSFALKVNFLWSLFLSIFSPFWFELFGIQKIDISREAVQSVEFSAPFELVASKDCTLGGFLGYFDTHFFDYDPSSHNSQEQTSLHHPVRFSTGPFTKKTHWVYQLYTFKSSSYSFQNNEFRNRLCFWSKIVSLSPMEKR